MAKTATGKADKKPLAFAFFEKYNTSNRKIKTIVNVKLNVKPS